MVISIKATIHLDFQRKTGHIEIQTNLKMKHMDLEVKHTHLVVPQNLTAHNNGAVGVEIYMDPEEVEDFQRKTGQIEIQINLKVKYIVSFKRFPKEDWTNRNTNEFESEVHSKL